MKVYSDDVVVNPGETRKIRAYLDNDVRTEIVSAEIHDMSGVLLVLEIAYAATPGREFHVMRGGVVPTSSRRILPALLDSLPGVRIDRGGYVCVELINPTMSSIRAMLLVAARQQKEEG